MKNSIFKHKQKPIHLSENECSTILFYIKGHPSDVGIYSSPSDGFDIHSHFYAGKNPMSLITGQIQIDMWTRCQTSGDDSMTIIRILVGRITLMLSLYFNFIITVSANIWYLHIINLAMLSLPIPV